MDSCINIRNKVISYIKLKMNYNKGGWYEKDNLIVEIRKDHIAIWLEWNSDGIGSSFTLFDSYKEWLSSDYIKALFIIKGALSVSDDMASYFGKKQFIHNWLYE